MAKLYFRYGAMGAAKTLNLLAVAHNYRAQGKVPFLIKPSVDTRMPGATIGSRAGLSAEADMVVEPFTNLLRDWSSWQGVACVLVDEAQFLTSQQVGDLRVVSSINDVPVICYGLRTDFQMRLFPGSKRLMELADSIEEIKTTCQFCDRKATQNLRMSGGIERVEIGDASYAPACFGCYALRADKIGGVAS